MRKGWFGFCVGSCLVAFTMVGCGEEDTAACDQLCESAFGGDASDSELECAGGSLHDAGYSVMTECEEPTSPEECSECANKVVGVPGDVCQDVVSTCF